MNLYRVLDANINRASEGLRMLEDVARFMGEDAVMTESLKVIRHSVRKTFGNINEKLIANRDSLHDDGLRLSRDLKLDTRENVFELIMANFRRVAEALRVVEESSKVLDEYEKSRQMENLRFTIYSLEQKMLSDWSRAFIPEGIYGITCEEAAGGLSNPECVRQMIDGGIKIIQYRDKKKEMDKKLKEAEVISALCKKNKVVFIVNDHVDIAFAVDADGVHLGQNDFSIAFARSMLKKNKIIGKSTHSPEQAKKAVSEGADYIGVGPIFKTPTKDRAPVTLSYLEYAIKNIKIPFVVIGGINEKNINEILKYNVKRIAIVRGIVGALNIRDKIKILQSKIRNNDFSGGK